MQFREDGVQPFLDLFEKRKEMIRNFEGCSYLSLLRDQNNSQVFFTYSIWDSPDSLETYRRSELFKNTWKLTKALFEKEAEANSVEEKFVLE